MTQYWGTDTRTPERILINVRRLCREQGISQAWFHRDLGFALDSSRAQLDRLTFGELRAICNALSVGEWELHRPVPQCGHCDSCGGKPPDGYICDACWRLESLGARQGIIGA